MKAFEFDHQLIRAYEHFSRSFSAIRAPDLKSEIDAQYDAGKFWPDALLSLNPRFMAGPTVDELVATGDLDDGTGKVFRFGTTPLRFHRHQARRSRRRSKERVMSSQPVRVRGNPFASSCRLSTRSSERGAQESRVARRQSSFTP